VLARDDGSCCDHTSTASHSWFLGGSSADGHKSWHTSRAHVRIEIADVNNNKPEFVDCTDYSRQARIEEGQYKAADAPIIIRVHATDDDAGQNGQVQYSVYYSRSEQRKPFVIDPNTGDLRPSPYFVFDREQKAFEEVTIKATDKGDHPLIGFCQFTVQVMDVNDNTPQFDRLLYETTIARSIQIGDSVLTVHADDRDSPPNARITYVLGIFILQTLCFTFQSFT
jgi:hypothetical protein